MSALNPIDSLFSSGGFSSSFDPSSIPGHFGNVFDQAMSQSTSKAQSARIAWLQSQRMKQSTLFDMFSDPKTSALGYGTSNLFGTGGPFGLPAWVYDAQRVLGGDPEIQNLLSLSHQVAELTQRQFHSSSMGSLGGNFESMF